MGLKHVRSQGAARMPFCVCLPVLAGRPVAFEGVTSELNVDQQVSPPFAPDLT